MWGCCFNGVVLTFGISSRGFFSATFSGAVWAVFLRFWKDGRSRLGKLRRSCFLCWCWAKTATLAQRDCPRASLDAINEKEKDWPSLVPVIWRVAGLHMIVSSTLVMQTKVVGDAAYVAAGIVRVENFQLELHFFLPSSSWSWNDNVSATLGGEAHSKRKRDNPSVAMWGDFLQLSSHSKPLFHSMFRQSKKKR